MPVTWQTTAGDVTKLLTDMEAAKAGLPTVLRRVVVYADTRISARAISTYMRNAGASEGKLPRQPGDTGPLRVASGKLARAVRGGMAAPAAGVEVDIDLLEGTIHYTKTITLPYAHINEKGGTITIRVTDKMRRYFWAMWYQTRDEKWRNMALTKKQSFTITIPARPYAEPATEHETPRIVRYAERQLGDHFGKHIG